MAGSGAQTLFLVDGNSLAYRAYFALPESMSTSDGRPTNAIFGFASMLTKIITEHDPRAAIVAWDAGMSGREEVYAEYKAQRPPRPDLLREQWPHLAPLAEAFGFHNVSVEGFEADDVIATLARRAREKGVEVMVVSGDRDVYQLIGEGIAVMSTSRGITETKTYDRDAVIERYGVPPERVTDLMGLRGDTSDNIPGVPGVGEKTAAKLLGEFGSLEEVLANVDQISGTKRKENLREHADDARLSKRLATLDDEVEVDLDLDPVLATEPDRSRLREAAAEFELRAVIERLDEEMAGELPEREAPDELALEPTEGTLADIPAGRVAVAASGEHWAVSDGEKVVAGSAPAAELGPALAGRALIAHDAKSLGGRHGALLAATGDGLELAHDTMIAAHLLDAARRDYELPELCADEGISVAGAAAGAQEGEQLALDAEETASGPADLAPRALLTWELAERQRPRLDELGLADLLSDIELPLVAVIAEMERNGLLLDTDRLAEISQGLAERIEALASEIHDLAGHEFTIGSPQQLGEVLFTELGLTKKRRGKTGYSTDARVLAQIRSEHPIVEKVEDWRELTKLKNTYIDALPGYVDSQSGRIHTTFSQVRASTGRLSSVEPNLQNIPVRSEAGRPVRSCFVAPKDSVLVSCDYNQVELRVLAHISGDEALREIFASDQDVHTATAAEVLDMEPTDVGVGERSKAKMVNYGIVYGLSAFGLADRLRIEQSEAAAYIKRYFERFAGVKQFIDETIERAREEGYVTTLLGRRRMVPELRGRQAHTRSLGERLAVNTVIQGTAADIIKLAMIRCHGVLREEGLEATLVLQIHDELLFEAPDAEAEEVSALARREMGAAFDLDPALAVEVGIGTDWLEAK